VVITVNIPIKSQSNPELTSYLSQKPGHVTLGYEFIIASMVNGAIAYFASFEIKSSDFFETIMSEIHIAIQVT
jgi:hypothetical protein